MRQKKNNYHYYKMNGFKSFYDIEQEQLAKARFQEKVKSIVGRDYSLPNHLKGRSIHIQNVNYEQLLQEFNYKRNGDFGWIKWISKTSRFHCYIRNNASLYIHQDVYSNGKHRAMHTPEMETELERMRIWAHNHKPRNKKYKEEKLSQEEIREALKQLKQSNEK